MSSNDEIVLSVGKLLGTVEHISKTMTTMSIKIHGMNDTLIRNTTIVDEHQLRSLRLETVVDGQVITLTELTSTLVKLQAILGRVELDMAPLVVHIDDHKRKAYVTEFFKNLGWIGKSVTGLITAGTVLVGVWGYVSAYIKV